MEFQFELEAEFMFVGGFAKLYGYIYYYDYLKCCYIELDFPAGYGSIETIPRLEVDCVPGRITPFLFFV